MLKVFSKCLLIVFPALSSRNGVSKRSQILGLRPRTCTTFSQHCSCSQELGKQVTHTWKFFLMANLDNYSNKILLLLNSTFFVKSEENASCSPCFRIVSAKVLIMRAQKPLKHTKCLNQQQFLFQDRNLKFDKNLIKFNLK